MHTLLYYIKYIFMTGVMTHVCFNIGCSKVAHPLIRDQLVGYIYNGFLVPVLAPALHKVGVSLLKH